MGGAATAALVVDLEFRGAQVPEAITGIAGGIEQVLEAAAKVVQFDDFLGRTARVPPGELEVRGEIYMPLDGFRAIV